MRPIAHHRYTFDEYVEIEESSPVRHEYLDGSIYAMAGGTPEHAAMAGAITAQLGSQMNGCRVYSSDLRVRVLATGLATYPEVTVVCGPSERDPKSASYITNPTLVVEVLSNATAHYDRGEKLDHYKLIPSLQIVVLVDHVKAHVEVWAKDQSHWSCTSYGPGDVIPLSPVSATIDVSAVYAAAKGA